MSVINLKITAGLVSPDSPITNGLGELLTILVVNDRHKKPAQGCYTVRDKIKLVCYANRSKTLGLKL